MERRRRLAGGAATDRRVGWRLGGRAVGAEAGRSGGSAASMEIFFKLCNNS